MKSLSNGALSFVGFMLELPNFLLLLALVCFYVDPTITVGGEGSGLTAQSAEIVAQIVGYLLVTASVIVSRVRRYHKRQMALLDKRANRF